MGNTEKVAVTVDRDVLARAERMRENTGESRSALVNRALAALLATGEHQERVARYIQAYREQPESEEEVEQARSMASTSMSRLPWGES
jgi:metal-responsive CopG/Arc/MetJ family transcriptional regulator